MPPLQNPIVIPEPLFHRFKGYDGLMEIYMYVYRPQVRGA